MAAVEATNLPRGRLRGFSGGAREIDEADAPVHGTLPAWLRGSLLLNGPALWELPGGRLAHWFDGYAMLHRLRIESGRVLYRSRFVQSRSYRDSVAAGRPSTGEFGTANPASLWQRMRGAPVTDNPAVVMSRHGQRWMALTETPNLTYFDPDTLATQEALDLGRAAQVHLMAAHGFTLADGSYLGVGAALGPRCHYRVLRLAPGQTQPEVIASIEVPATGYLHGFALAAGHAIVWDLALRVKPLGLRFGGASYKDNFRWQPEGGSALFAVDLTGGQVRRWAIPALMAFHATQAWSEGQDLVLELAAYDDATIFEDLTLERRRRGEPLAGRPRLVRYRLQPGRDAATPEPLGIELELQQVNPAAVGVRRASCSWGIGSSARGEFGDHVERVDSVSLGVQRWQRGAATHLEPLFVPRPGGAADDDGVLLVPTLADPDAGGVIAVLDAHAMQPLAEIRAPQVLPFGFHAAFAAPEPARPLSR